MPEKRQKFRTRNIKENIFGGILGSFGSLGVKRRTAYSTLYACSPHYVNFIIFVDSPRAPRI